MTENAARIDNLEVHRAGFAIHDLSFALPRGTVLGAAAALVLGMIAGIPDSVVQAVSAVLLSIAAVAVLGQALYKVIGYAVPDGTNVEPTSRADG